MAEETTKPELKYFIRIANTDLDGNKSVQMALTKIKGISVMFSSAVLTAAHIQKTMKAGYLSDAQVEKIDDVLKDPLKFHIPTWMLNRQRDPEDASNKHLLGSNLTFIQDNDVKMMKKIKSYRGIRHSLGQPVRGQRTRSNFRKNKGKVMGVKRNAKAKAGK